MWNYELQDKLCKPYTIKLNYRILIKKFLYRDDKLEKENKSKRSLMLLNLLANG